MKLSIALTISGSIITSLLGASLSTAQSIQLTEQGRIGLPPRGLAIGLSAIGNINFSVQAYPAVGARFQKNSYVFPTGEMLASYTWPHGWRIEGGVGLGSVAAVTIDAREQFGRNATVSFGTTQIPIRLYRYLSFNRKSRLSIGPHVGLQVVSLSVGEKKSSRNPIYSGKPEYGSQSNSFRTIQEHTLTYQIGACVNYVAPKIELSAFVRYTNSFGNPVVAEGNWEYDLQGIEQPALYTTSRLENVAIGIAVRRTLFSR